MKLLKFLHVETSQYVMIITFLMTIIMKLNHLSFFLELFHAQNHKVFGGYDDETPKLKSFSVTSHNHNKEVHIDKFYKIIRVDAAGVGTLYNVCNIMGFLTWEHIIYVYLSAAYKLLLEPKRRTSNTTNYCHINQPATLSAPLSAVRPTAVVSKLVGK